MRNWKSNPYPHFEDCEDAMSALWEEVTRQDISTELDEMVRYINYWLPKVHRPDNSRKVLEDLEWFERLQTFSSPDQLKGLFLEIWDKLGDASSHTSVVMEALGKFSPPSVLMGDFSIARDVEFVHFFPSIREQELRKFGLYGRATPSRLTATRLVPDVLIRNNGFIFAYEPPVRDSAKVLFAMQVRGVASQALRMFYFGDDESQLIVPLKCVDFDRVSIEYNPIYWNGSEELQDMIDDNEASVYELLPHPRKFELGSSKECEDCGAQFALSVKTLPPPGFGYAELEPDLCERCIAGKSKWN